MASSVETAEPELITPKRGEKVVLNLRWCIVRGQILGCHGGGTEHHLLWQWPYVRDIDTGRFNAIRAKMPAESLDFHGLYGVVHDTGEKAGTLELYRCSKIEDPVEKRIAAAHNDALWMTKRYEDAEALFISDHEWETMIAPRR